MELNKIWNESNEITMKEHIDEKSIDVILTSPFYNTDRHQGKNNTTENTNPLNRIRYDTVIDSMSNDDYLTYIVGLFDSFDKILKSNGVVLWNVGYGNENPNLMFLTISDIIKKSNFEIVDVICWKKKSAMPDNLSSNKLTRIWEFIFVFCRKNEFSNFYCNKKLSSYRTTGQKMYSPIYNFIEADNNDEVCPFNKATYSTDLCRKLLKIYAPKNAIVYDPFKGSETTALACKMMGLNYIGSEISSNQVDWAENRIKNGKGARTEDLNKESIFEM